jgi:hypothetical protein
MQQAQLHPNAVVQQCMCLLPVCLAPAVASSNFDIALSVDLTGSFSEDLPIIKALAPNLWQGLAAKISGDHYDTTLVRISGRPPRTVLLEGQAQAIRSARCCC